MQVVVVEGMRKKSFFFLLASSMDAASTPIAGLEVYEFLPFARQRECPGNRLLGARQREVLSIFTMSVIGDAAAQLRAASMFVVMVSRMRNCASEAYAKWRIPE
jgi:hypothetical protein